jgi:hypothetical protein
MVKHSQAGKDNKWQKKLDQVLSLPIAWQREALKKIRKEINTTIDEQWNTDFGKNSLYQAWSEIDPMRGLYNTNRKIIRDFLADKKKWIIIEIGGGNGALWKDFFQDNSEGTFILIDPVKNSHNAVSSELPGRITFRSIIEPVENVSLPAADIIVCSLMLHHIPGFDMAHNKRFGINSPGKYDILCRFLQSIRIRNGICIINESDIYTDIDLPPDDPVLIHRLIDSYIKRAGKSVAKKIDDPDISGSVKKRLELILIHWLIDQVEIAGAAPVQARDVYELDTIEWLKLLALSGAKIINHKFTDDWHLFHQYIIK